MKWLRFGIITVLHLALLGGLTLDFGTDFPTIGKFIDPVHGFWQQSPSVNEHPEGTVNLPALKAGAEVVYDSLHIPHIFASSDYDLYYLQGYTTAQDRLWQMEFQAYAAAGRISEIMGKGGEEENFLNYDRLQRRRGMVRSANLFLEKTMQNESTRTVVQAYTDGVNAYIDQLEFKDYPMEYKLLDYEPEQWSPLKTALMLKYMSAMLNLGERDLEYTNALRQLGADVFNELYPDVLPGQEPVVDRTDNWKFEAVKPKKPPVIFPQKMNQPDSVIIQKLKELEKERQEKLKQKRLEAAKAKTAQYLPQLFLGQPEPQLGSNNWAVAPSKTKNGNAILANDPHLELNLPSIWYISHLNAPGINVMGVTVPGVPGIIIGFNDSTAWGVTNAKRDVVDWYAIEFKDRKYEQYLLDGKWEKLEKTIDTIFINGEDPLIDSIFHTKWGPIVYDNQYKPKDPHHHYAMKWVSHLPSEELLALYKLNRANSYEDYKAAIPTFASPAQNMVFASASGDIALWVQGKFPIKWEEQGKFAMDGTKSAQDWQGFIPQEQLVHVLNPQRGFVSSANQHAVDPSYPYYAYDYNYEYDRNRRINGQLASMNNITIKDMMLLQNDNFNMSASEHMRYWLSFIPDSILTTEAEKEAKAALLKWNFYNEASEQGAIYYELWSDELYSAVWDEFSNKSNFVWPNRQATFHFIKQDSAFKYLDIADTKEKEGLRQLLEKTFTIAAEKAETWQNDNPGVDFTWARFKDTEARHLLQLKPLSEVNINNGGNRHIVNATSKRHGPSWRMIVELTKKGPVAYGTYPGGQSGNVGSKYYNNLLPSWVKGKYHKMPFFNEPPTDGAFTTVNFTNSANVEE